MEKLSGIIPPSSRQVWQTGEIEKPRRLSEPTLDDNRFGIGNREQHSEQLPGANVVGEQAIHESFDQRGSNLNKMA